MLDVAIDPHRIRIGRRFSVTFQRTLRIPDDGRIYPLPPGLGAFPIFSTDSYHDRLGSIDLERGSAFIPLHQREALWLGFTAAAWKPNAVKVCVGGVNAVSGASCDVELRAEPQDYLVCPEQPWLDGINTAAGAVRQFVAMPLGHGYTIEQGVSGRERTGAIQISAYEPKAGVFPDEPPPMEASGPVRSAARSPLMGIGAGGVMRQKIYPDPHGLQVWDQSNFGRVVVHLVNSDVFEAITGQVPPPTPIDPETYAQHGLPWFDLYDEHRGAVAPSERLAGVKTIAERHQELAGETERQPGISITELEIRKLRHAEDAAGEVRAPREGLRPSGKPRR